MSTIKPLSATSPTAVADLGADVAVAPGRAAEIAATPGSDSARAVLAAAQAGQVTSAEVISRLAAEAALRSGAPPATRAAVEARLQELLRSDPTLGALLARAGVEG